VNTILGTKILAETGMRIYMPKNKSGSYRRFCFNSPSAMKINPKITDLFLSSAREQEKGET
jgi:hypothetical protein